MESGSSAASTSSKRRKRPQLRIRLCLSPQAYQKHHHQQRPPPPPRVFEPGDRVYYRSKSANATATTTATGAACGTVVQQNATNGNDNDDKKKGKCSVHFDGESQQRQVSTTRLLPIYSVSPQEIVIFVTDETNLFRQLAVSQIQGTATSSSSSSSTSSSSSLSAARVLEIGCSTGETSTILWRQNRAISSWVGLDTSADMIEIVQKKIAEIMPSSPGDDAIKVHCQRLDALVDPLSAIKAACTFHANGPTIIFVDIGGNREEVGVLRMLQFLLNGPFPDIRQIIIKSRALCQSLVANTTATNSSAFFKDNGHDGDGLVVERVDSWLEEQLGRFHINSLPKHPQKAPIRLCPADDKTPICRYHNYHKNGCHKNDGSCPFDHLYCHFCLQPGHKALDCAQVQQPAKQRVDKTSD